MTALRRPDSARTPPGGVKWNEGNLEENERIKALINVKIDEPKTPYHGPLDEAQLDEEELSHLALDGSGPSATSNVHAANTAAPCGNGHGPLQPEPSPSHSCQPALLPYGAPDMHMHMEGEEDVAASQPAQPHSQGDTDCGGGGPLEEAPHLRRESSASGGGGLHGEFAVARRQHYNMRAALAMARELLSEDMEEDVEGGGHEEEGGERGDSGVEDASPAAAAPHHHLSNGH